METLKIVRMALTAAACALVVAACGSSSSSSSSSSSGSSASSSSSAGASTSADPAVVKLVPASVKSKGTITVASDASYAPNEFFASDGHTIIGMDADLSKAIAAEMGLKASVVNATFESIIPGLAAGRYDMGASSFTDTKARQQTVDFVDYFKAGESFFTSAQGGTNISTIGDICGKSVAVEKATVEQDDAQAQSKKCTAAGKSAVSVLVFPDQNGANLALHSGRAQLGFADSPVAAYAVKQSSGAFKLVGAAYATAPYGLALPKNSGLPQAVQAALLALIKNGTYGKIMTKWGLQAGAIPADQVKINGGTS